MKLNFDQIKSITQGATTIKKVDDYIVFRRYTDEQLALYTDTVNPRKTITCPETRCLSSAGIKFRFKTNSNKITLTVKFLPICCRDFYSMDVFENGKPLGRISNIESLPDCNFSGWYIVENETTQTFELSKGEKEIVVYFPYSTDTKIKEVILDDNSYFVPVVPEKKLLAFGDSITHGYDSLFSANSYANRLADKLNYEIFNKAIGGEIYFPEIAKTKESFSPDIITVAYGTNDWSNLTAETFKKNCEDFYYNLTNNYPNVKIFALTPLWRKELLTETKIFGDFSLVAEIITETVKKYPTVTVVDCFDFIPHESKFYSDGRLHPNDDGFKFYAEKLYDEIKKYL